MKRFLMMGIIFSGLLLGGCTFSQQAVKITPQVTVAQSNVGEGRQVRVTVVDERPKTTLGTRGAKGVGADMTIDGNIVAIFQTAVEDGLRRQGFVPTQDASESRELRAEIRNLDYGVITGFWAGTLKVDCSLKGICRRGSERPYERLHRGEFTESIQVVQGDEANDRYVSEAVSKAVNALLTDQELIRCLAE